MSSVPLSASRLSAKSATAYRGHDFPEHLPLPFEVEMVPVTIEESVHYPAVGAPSNQEWLSIASPSVGYIRLGPEDRTFVVSMFHELHCLRMINGAFSKMKGANVGHIKHCLNYVRQGVLCDPDLTLEPGNFEERDFEVERLGGTHLCKNWNPIYEWVDNNFETWANKTGWGESSVLVLSLLVLFSPHLRRPPSRRWQRSSCLIAYPSYPVSYCTPPSMYKTIYAPPNTWFIPVFARNSGNSPPRPDTPPSNPYTNVSQPTP